MQRMIDEELADLAWEAWVYAVSAHGTDLVLV
jgi:hypothetical protein